MKAKSLYQLIIEYLAINWDQYKKQLKSLPRECRYDINKRWFTEHNMEWLDKMKYNYTMFDKLDIAHDLKQGWLKEGWLKINQCPDLINFHNECKQISIYDVELSYYGNDITRYYYYISKRNTNYEYRLIIILEEENNNVIDYYVNYSFPQKSQYYLHPFIDYYEPFMTEESSYRYHTNNIIKYL